LTPFDLNLIRLPDLTLPVLWDRAYLCGIVTQPESRGITLGIYSALWARSTSYAHMSFAVKYHPNDGDFLGI
jgi:hypothetical protein